MYALFMSADSTPRSLGAVIIRLMQMLLQETMLE